MGSTHATQARASTGTPSWEAWRVVGDLLDEAERRPRFLAVVDGGIVGAVEDPEAIADAGISWVDTELTTAARAAPARRTCARPSLYPTLLAPTGYGDLLRTLALRAHEEAWINLRLLFLNDRLWVCHGPRATRQECLFDGAAVRAALDSAYRRRHDPLSPTRMPVIERPLPHPAGPWTVAREEPYARVLARVGRVLDRDRAAEPLVAETTNGLLVVTLGVDGRQRARVADAAAPVPPRWLRAAGKHETALGALGALLDDTGGHHGLAAARPDGDWLLSSTVAREPRVVSGDPLTRPHAHAS
jgi:hypothetical protein